MHTSFFRINIIAQFFKKELLEFRLLKDKDLIGLFKKKN